MNHFTTNMKNQMHGEYHEFADEGTNAVKGRTSKLNTSMLRGYDWQDLVNIQYC